ncbi:signal peptidase I [Sulfurimonas crateris]|uniref:Signal peptidase I n=1 Tax=Sulfurimonas crateris TaxID=2574727 RepID=A0A4U2Z8F0_9BACT|nr:signal peptidase I [Sulfurimonas crateris]TKI69812.1 signal peptidase I [Sulfurimonas crateris]
MKEILHKTYKFSNSWTGTIIIVLFVIFFIAQAFKIPSGSMKDSLLIGDHLFAKKFAYGVSMPHIPFLEVSIMPWSDKLRLIDGDTPQRGDIVIFRPPHNTKQHFVKRCFAIGGDEVIFSDKTLYLRPNEGDDYIHKHFPKEKIVKILNKLWIKNPMIDKHSGIHYDANHDIFNDMISHMLSPNYTIDMEPKLIEGLPVIDYRLPFNAFYKKVEQGKYYMIGDNRDHSNDSRFWGAVPYENIEGTPWFVYFSIDENWEIRWDRIGKTPTNLEENEYLERARNERLTNDKADHGIY